MMNPGLEITVIDVGADRTDGIMELLIKASSGSHFASQQFYGLADWFREFASQLKNFPTDIDSRVRLEIGGKEKPWATYLLLEVFCYEPTGRTAIRVIMNTHFAEPHYAKSEFFIQCYPAAINKLGEALCNWNAIEAKTFQWMVECK
jgi:hypothetical protein